jgi:hypothetical protein
MYFEDEVIKWVVPYHKIQLDYMEADDCGVVDLFGRLHIAYPMKAIEGVEWISAKYNKHEKKWSGRCRLNEDPCCVSRYFSCKDGILYIGVER